MNDGYKSAKTGLKSTQWRSAVSETYFPLDAAFTEERSFRGELDMWSLGVVGLSQMRCDGVLYKRHKRHFLDEKDSSLLITLPIQGEVGFSQNKRKTSCAPGGFLVERGDSPYEFWHEQTNELLVLKVPTESVRSRIGPTDRLGALSFDGTQGVASFFLDVVKSTAAHAAHLDENARKAAGAHILDLLCLSIRSDDRVLDSNTSSIRAAHLHRAEQFIRNNLGNHDLSSSDVADACNVSLRYLQQLFLDADKSIVGFIREKRLSRSFEDLSAGDAALTVSEIAQKWGFSDQPQFNKAYRAQFGCTPTETRKSALKDQRPAAP